MKKNPILLTLYIFSVLALVISFFWFLRDRSLEPALATATSVFFLLFFVITSLNKQKESEATIQAISNAESKAESQPEKVKPAWDLARVTLESYFNRNLSQVTSIFWLSVVVMCVGFGIIIWGISQAIQSQNANTPAIITGVTGIITEFIGATFLFIYRSTIQQALDYSKTLERINSVGMAMQILDTMPDKTEDDDLKSKTKATLVELLIKQAHNISDDKKI